MCLSGLRSWRNLGDVIASAFALVCHGNIHNKPNIPAFLVELRRTAFERIYSGDKNLAIFLGRPPRMCKRFSYFQVPSCSASWDAADSQPITQLEVQDWCANTEINYRAGTHWSALCASIKEEILELLFSEDRSYHAQKARSATQTLQHLYKNS